MKVAIKTLGCKANRFESDAVEKHFQVDGITFVRPQDEADYYIINTCTITHVADKKGRQAIRSLKKQFPDAKTIAFGCGTRTKDNTYQKVKELDYLFTKTTEVIDFLRGEAEARNIVCNSSFIKKSEKKRTRALIKIQDGCNNFCSFCIVPITRGSEKSYDHSAIMKQVRDRLDEGYKELVITGIIVGTWQQDNKKFEDLLHDILQEPKLERLRLSSLEPECFTDRFLELFDNPKFCRHLHLCLQSGSDNTLQTMRRRYDTKLYREVVNAVRTKAPDIGITTDVIVGFPGETNEDFEETYQFCNEMNFSKMHIFKYSPRKGTQAAMMKNKIPYEIQAERSKKLHELEANMKKAFHEQFIGKEMEVLFEQEHDGGYTGYTTNYIKVIANSADDLTNVIEKVRIESINPDLSVCATVL